MSHADEVARREQIARDVAALEQRRREREARIAAQEAADRAARERERNRRNRIAQEAAAERARQEAERNRKGK